MIFHIFVISLSVITLAHVSAIVPDFRWSPVEKSKNISLHHHKSHKNHVLASDMIGDHPVYVCMTTIRDRVKYVAESVRSILRGDVLPTQIYVMISKEPYMKDKGIEFSALPKSLIELADTKPVTIVYTENIGPHRKLLPILSKYWNDDCVIVTVDDDVIYHRSTLAELIKYYILSGRDSVVALRSHRIGLCTSNQALKVSEYKYWPLVSYGLREMLQLPTGTGGVLYRPDFFHPIVFDRKFLSITSTGDDIAFRLACMVKDVPVVTACRVSRYPGGAKVCPDTLTIKTPGGNGKMSKMDSSSILKRSLSTEYHHNINNNYYNVSYHNLSITNEYQRQLRELKERISLWNINKSGKNNVMWNNAVNYIEKTLELNFYAIYNFYYLKERKECLNANSAKKHLCGLLEDCNG